MSQKIYDSNKAIFKLIFIGLTVIKISKYSFLTYVATLSFAMHSTWAYADTALHVDDANLYEGNKFAIGVGLGIVKFDTNVKVTDKQSSGLPLYIDLEGKLNLPEVSHVTTLYGVYRFNEKHKIIFGYFDINRHTSLLSINENYEDVFIIKANITLSDKTRFYNLSYGYSLFQDDRSDITFVAGINGMDLRLVVDVSGEITVNGSTKSAATLAEANVFAPLPLIGLDFGFSFTPEWSMSTKISLVAGSFDDVSAGVLQTSINSRYQFTKHTGLLLGMTYFNADVTIDDETEVTDISYGYSGAFFGMHFAF